LEGAWVAPALAFLGVDVSTGVCAVLSTVMRRRFFDSAGRPVALAVAPYK
jgi:hypothetical protein